MPTPATYLLADIEERFRQLLLSRLHRAERLSEAFMNTLLRWSHSGFSVHAGQLDFDDELEKLENLASYLSRAPIRLGRITETPEGRVCYLPADPKSRSTSHSLLWRLCQSKPKGFVTERIDHRLSILA